MEHLQRRQRADALPKLHRPQSGPEGVSRQRARSSHLQSVAGAREADRGGFDGGALDRGRHGSVRHLLRWNGDVRDQVLGREAHQAIEEHPRLASLRRLPQSVFESTDEGLRREQQAQAAVVVQRRQRGQLESPQRNAHQVQQHDEPEHAENPEISERHRHVDAEAKFRAEQHALEADRGR